MKILKERLFTVEKHIKDEKICIMILGLGSVGTYLLDYIVSKNDPSIKVVVVGRNQEKMQTKVNIVRISALIREQCKSDIEIVSGVDFNDIEAIAQVIKKYQPDFIVNSSRAYPGLKYGSISWKNVRAYGIWSPLAIRFTKNIMEACDCADSEAIVINTSYSDAVIPWLKSAKMPYPDFGSGNLNHLVPRIRYAVANILQVEDFWNVDVMFAAGHFHDVCISKEGQTEGVRLPLAVYYHGQKQEIPQEQIFSACSIAMPVDATRNMMNASSNFRLIFSIIEAVRTNRGARVFSPGAFGELGGYPVNIECKDHLTAEFDTSIFSMEEMKLANSKSMYLDGIEKIEDGTLFYTDELIKKAKKAFGVELPKYVSYGNIDEIAKFIIDEIIKPQLAKL